MGIHDAEAAIEYSTYPDGRTVEHSTWYGAGARAVQLFPDRIVGRAGKTSRDHSSGSWGNRFANRASRNDKPKPRKTGR